MFGGSAVWVCLKTGTPQSHGWSSYWSKLNSQISFVGTRKPMCGLMDLEFHSTPLWWRIAGPNSQEEEKGRQCRLHWWCHLYSSNHWNYGKWGKSSRNGLISGELWHQKATHDSLWRLKSKRNTVTGRCVKLLRMYWTLDTSHRTKDTRADGATCFAGRCQRFPRLWKGAARQRKRILTGQIDSTWASFKTVTPWNPTHYSFLAMKEFWRLTSHGLTTRWKEHDDAPIQEVKVNGMVPFSAPTISGTSDAKQLRSSTSWTMNATGSTSAQFVVVKCLCLKIIEHSL